MSRTHQIAFFTGFFLLGTLALNSLKAQDAHYKAQLAGKYTYGDLDPVYLEDDDGKVDSSFSYCSYGELDIYYVNDTVFFDVEVCNATYHIGSFSGHINFLSEDKGQYVYIDSESGDDMMNCHLEFELSENSISIEEINCQAWHGARASFNGDFVKLSSNDWSDLKAENEVKSLTEDFFKAFNDFDVDLVEGLLEAQCQFSSWHEKSGDTNNVLKAGNADGLLKMLKAQPPIREDIGNVQVHVNGKYAIAWMDYWFYFKDELHHCGANLIQWTKTNEGWKVSHLTDNERSFSCEEYDVSGEMESPTMNYLIKEVNATMNRWHQAAADANANDYFGLMADECIYLGTDPSERWTKQSFVKFAKPYFDKGKAWAFNTNWRNVYFSDNKNTAWFEESLDTHMGECRGSGVLKRIQNGWEIQHYNLSVTIANEKMNDFRVLTGVKR